MTNIRYKKFGTPQHLARSKDFSAHFCITSLHPLALFKDYQRLSIVQLKNKHNHKRSLTGLVSNGARERQQNDFISPASLKNENTKPKKEVPPMQSMQLFVTLCQQIEEPYKYAQWRQGKQVQPV